MIFHWRFAYVAWGKLIELNILQYFQSTAGQQWVTEKLPNKFDKKPCVWLKSDVER